METLLTWGIAGAVLAFFLIRYWREHKRSDEAAREKAARGPVFSDGPRAQHPQIMTEACIGCGACVSVCPEGDVLALVSGKATIVNAHKCIGHSLCAEACPVGAITMVMAKPGSSADMPVISAEYETSVPNLFIVGELGGLALIKNAVNQGRDCVDAIAQRLAASPERPVDSSVWDVIIVGAGPAGISASLRAAEHRLTALTLERESVGGTVSKYPRQKLVMTSPVEFPLHGKFSKTSLSKEDLLRFWEKIMARTDLNIQTGAAVDAVQRGTNGVFQVKTSKGEYRARAVVLAMGRAGTPRKLGVKGEELPHVLYRLIEADHYTDQKILVVGGGDSAVEAAMGLAHQSGNQVTLSYRRGEFSRLKDRNAKRIAEQMTAGKIEVLFNSMPVEFRPGSVVIEVGGELRELPNDLVWIFAGGTSPSEFLKAAGIKFGGSPADTQLQARSIA
ncbi:NAD(P)-binding domain-containing protein [Occallatibacter savannae]|uniref:NAD(P)-binding domain-containing protein n=1 Tax=Occallatibacter savannae TaxID=1002691 RepID=UPI000D69F305|nr:NAD(P)-binding domain-containing protein [Occallatibacter savannae]